MLEKILAKSEPRESLVTHTQNVIKIWEQLRIRYGHQLNLSDDFWVKSYLSVLFHDLGKVADNFQDVLSKKKDYDSNYIRHEFLSGMVLLLYGQSAYKAEPESLFAVFSHHKPLTDELFKSQDSFASITVSEENLKVLIDWYNKQLKANNQNVIRTDLGQQLSRLFEKNLENGVNHLYTGFEQFFNKYKANEISKSIRTRYIFYKALLNIADWTASAPLEHRNLNKGHIYTRTDLEEKIKQQAKKNFQGFRIFQLESFKTGSVLAIAPTGSGKTEAALLWASQKNEFDKIVYLLPTRVTSNAIYQRLINYFGKENCAVVHSSAYLYQKNLDDTFEKKDYLKDKTFFKNVNICTIDQVLTQGFNLGFWEIKTFHLFKAKVIIDEIHLYEPYTLGLIITTIKYLKRDFQTEFFIMTATMPQNLQVLLKQTLEIGDESLIKDRQLLNETRNRFEVREELVDELESEIIEALNKYNKVLLVVNTVDEAIRLYEHYKGKKAYVICYHSRFIQKDRISKEKEITTIEGNDSPILLIATQVVEVSLDIDFDIMFTENAPMDAIVQRAGRVNRKRKKVDSKIIVFKHQQKSEDWIYNKEDFLNKTFEILKFHKGQKLTEQQLTNLVNLVYDKYDVTLEKAYQEGLNAYHRIQIGDNGHLHYIKDNDGSSETYTREGLDSVNIIPLKFKESLIKASDIEKSLHEVSIRKKKIWADPKREKDKWFTYFDCEYNYETGLKFLKKGSDRGKCVMP
ncbi:CRISPR-associated helicase Cas3' [Runella sp. MFBS21]|uniref:CRISPR-associated helicase Cas3' n=1 Tax=Runella sp. MFBS21 TaxID=3034018 RepID=UPI0023F98ABD|nr:CRISPR-associated helicase Cas3' [Runella sp. MFBS21]MDF7818594.1 CRISPR-associated helicase Cas3' [Runella sp. MFBS21]